MSRGHFSPIRRRPSVLLVSYRYPPDFSGASVQAQAVNRILIGKIDVLVLSSYRKGYPREMNGIDVYRRPKFFPLCMRASKWEFYIWGLYIAFYILTKGRTFDVIHVLDGFFPSDLVAVVGKIIGRPVLVKNSGARVAMKNDSIYRKFRQSVLRKWAEMIAISDETESELLDAGFRPSAIHRIENGVDCKRFYPPSSSEERMVLRRKLKLPPSGFIVVFIGSLMVRKGVNDLLDAWGKIKLVIPEGELVLISPEREASIALRLEEIIRTSPDSGLRDVGWVDSVEDYLRAADVFAFPTFREGLPNALMEAMACGLPCISRNVGGVVDLIVDNENGILIDGDDAVGQFIAALLKVREQSDWAEDLGRNAAETIRRRFKIQDSAERYRTVYRHLGGFSSCDEGLGR